MIDDDVGGDCQGSLGGLTRILSRLLRMLGVIDEDVRLA